MRSRKNTTLSEIFGGDFTFFAKVLFKNSCYDDAREILRNKIWFRIKVTQ